MNASDFLKHRSATKNVQAYLRLRVYMVYRTMDTIFGREINAINLGILTKLCSDYNLPFDEVVAKYQDFVPSQKPLKKRKAPKKPKRIEPVHNHRLGEEGPEPCLACLTIGNSLLPDTRKIFVE